MKRKYHISEVECDTDGEEVDLPTEFDVEIDCFKESDPEYLIEEYLSDWLSNTNGFCHNGFKYKEV